MLDLCDEFLFSSKTQDTVYFCCFFELSNHVYLKNRFFSANKRIKNFFRYRKLFFSALNVGKKRRVKMLGCVDFMLVKCKVTAFQCRWWILKQFYAYEEAIEQRKRTQWTMETNIERNTTKKQNWNTFQCITRARIGKKKSFVRYTRTQRSGQRVDYSFVS